MKHITNAQYKAIKEHLLDWLDQHPNPYDELFNMINGEDYESKGHYAGKPLLRRAQIKKIWDSKHYQVLVKIAIYVHYKGNIIDTTKSVRKVITQGEIKYLASTIKTRIKEESKKDLAIAI